MHEKLVHFPSLQKKLYLLNKAAVIRASSNSSYHFVVYKDTTNICWVINHALWSNSNVLLMVFYFSIWFLWGSTGFQEIKYIVIVPLFPGYQIVNRSNFVNHRERDNALSLPYNWYGYEHALCMKLQMTSYFIKCSKSGLYETT